MSPSDLLEARIASAMTLRQFDEDFRRMKISKLVGKPSRDRASIEATLVALGGQSWPYSPDGDNSWLP